MVLDTHTVSSEDTVVGSIDATESSDEFIIADIAVDDAWLSMRADDAPTLPAMR
ncbi:MULTISPECIES: DUF7556 family protein [Natrialbaceae]|uniref:DUF7556 family protein n=1 Tax=Natrialbaceae TaxID=1644061 RepID=UPI00207C51E8|nr:hypothetical protein [Natronococcus sp. CG52]